MAKVTSIIPSGKCRPRSAASRPRLRIRSGFLRRRGGMLGGGALVGNAPDRSAGVVGDEQCAVLGDRECRRAAPDLGTLLARGPKAGREILVIAFGPAVLERHARDLVTGRYRAVPRAFDGDEQAALVFRRELVALVEDE